MGELINSFKKYPPWAWWVMSGRIVSELTMNSPWACQVNTPSPPVCAFEGARIAGWGSIDGSKRRVVWWRGSLVVYLLGVAHFLVCIEGLERRVRGHLH